jgi:hypothetical protein
MRFLATRPAGMPLPGTVRRGAKKRDRAATERFRGCLDRPGGNDHVEDLLALLIAWVAVGNDL